MNIYLIIVDFDFKYLNYKIQYEQIQLGDYFQFMGNSNSFNLNHFQMEHQSILFDLFSKLMFEDQLLSFGGLEEFFEGLKANFNIGVYEARSHSQVVIFVELKSIIEPCCEHDQKGKTSLILQKIIESNLN